MASQQGINFKQLFLNQAKDGSTTDFVSEPFRLDNHPSQIAWPALRTYGSLGEGAGIALQTLHPAKNPLIIDEEDPKFTDNSVDSEDWQNTDDQILEQGYKVLDQSKLWFRLKITGLVDESDFSAEVIENA